MISGFTLLNSNQRMPEGRCIIRHLSHEEFIKMTEKQKIIQQMLDMQRDFIKLERKGEFKAEEYYDTDGDSILANYKSRFNELAMRLVDLAHAEKGSHR